MAGRPKRRARLITEGRWKKPSCAYVCTDRELFRTFGIRTIRRVK